MINILVKIFLFFFLIHKGDFHKEEECVEVGFARTSHLNVDQSYRLAKETLLPLWEQENLIKIPKYTGLSVQIKNITRSATLLEQTTKNILALIRKTRVGKRCPENWLMKGIEKHVMPLMQLDKELAEHLGLVMSFRCLIGSPYPNVDGTCVNEETPDYGSNGSKFLRLIPPISAKDGFSFRVSVKDGQPLPSARKVAQLIRKHIAKPPVTSLFSEFSHFINSDTISIPESPFLEDVDCCKDPEREDCEPIFLDADDPEASNIKCINFKRSLSAQAIIGHRESLSLVSTYFDANPVYGTSNEEAFANKEGYFGFLKSPDSLDKESSEEDKRNCKFPESFEGCFGLTANDNVFPENLRLLILLEHNYIAEKLAELNPHFDDSLLYNEARRINIARYNSILYGQYLPSVISKEVVEKQSLQPGAQGQSANFIHDVNPGILTSFALFASRNPSMKSEWRGDREDYLQGSQFNSVRGDKYVDILAMEIQRARDHGLTSYGEWRSFCDSGKHIGSWDDVKEIFSEAAIEDLKELYQDQIKDLDITVALLEPFEEGAMVGKVHNCILVDQFARLRTGNRLYWEHGTSQLTDEQRNSILNGQSAADLLCRHFKLNKIATNPFLLISDSNPEIDCKDVPAFDINPWVDVSLIETMKEKEENRKKEEAEKKKLEEENAEKKLAEEAAEKKKLAEEAAEKKKLAEEAAEKKKLVEEAAEKKKLVEEAAEKKKLAEEVAEKKKLAEEVAEKKKEADRKRAESELKEKESKEAELTKQAAERKKIENKLKQKEELLKQKEAELQQKEAKKEKIEAEIKKEESVKKVEL